MSMIRCALVVGVSMGLLAACGEVAQPSSSATPSRSSVSTPSMTRSLGPDDVPTSEKPMPTPDLPCGTTVEAESIPELVGLSAEEAAQRAEELHYKVRIVGSDGKCLARTEDLDSERASLYIEDDKVIWAELF